MAKVTTISQQAFDAKKAEVISKELIRKEINISEFQIINDNTIEIHGKQLPISKTAFKRVLRRMRIPHAFARRFEQGYGSDGLKQLIQMVKMAKSNRNDQKVTIVLDPDRGQIVDILPKGYASISNEAFVGFAEGYIDKYNLSPTHFGSDGNGSATINCTSDSSLLRIPGMENEIFQTGVTFSNSVSNGLQVQPYMTRLVCANGMSSTAFAENYGLTSLDTKSVEQFNEHMLQLATTGFQPVGIADQIKKAANTDASLFELQRAASAIMNTDEKISYEYAQKFAPIERAKRAYDQIGSDTSKFTNAQLKTAKSGMSVWDVVNGMTNFASNDTKYGVDEYKASNLMVTAGNILMKKKFDTEDLILVNPFAKNDLLTERETTILRGE
jgi:hypothetical protein